MRTQLIKGMDADSDYVFSMLPELDGFDTRMLATFFIFVVSLLAVSFPTLARRVSFLRIPRIIFFIGKHFGTGVILSTAFVHLLQDSFEALRSPAVLARWKIGKYVGLIVLCSLLAIFLVEYVSTSYVARLEAYVSPPTSIPPTPGNEFAGDLEGSPPDGINPEQTPLAGSYTQRRDPSYGAVHTHEHLDGDASAFFEGHHRHEPRQLHSAHHERSRPSAMYGPGGQVDSGSESHHNHVDDITHSYEHDYFHDHDHLDGHKNNKTNVVKKRQIVGILVLQLGIMIHSLVIGLTLSITSGPDFATLLVALMFHQLFEGLSLGIRIASLPSPQEPEFRYLSILKPVLACLFAVTTPAGILLGMLVFRRNDDMAHVRLTQGIMSAISAGMLTYAACVEMLAGDFVMDPLLWRSSVGRQALALFSLAAGVTAMALVGS